ncbi:hypothetical protein BC936DRAFT_147873 [Jimgerdemannia flammicorona]|uniref:Galactose oxidase n=1 Tax=Jimgerdemannia flammicorona TaxID=994334 RepID=A0A433D4C7_9FUNG|nr:hypothetical protein BC936DRAFT_147873 [Jimgerdemannia flammicorona]
MGFLSSLVTNDTQIESLDVFKFSQSTQSWTLIPNQLPNVLFRRLHRIVWLSSGLLIPIGGASSFSPNIFAPMSDVITYNTITGKWLAVTATGAIPAARQSHSATLAPDGYSIILYAGQDEVGNVLGDVAVLDTRTFVWSNPNISGMAPRPRVKHTAVLVGDALIIMGGGLDPNLTISSNIISETIVLNTTTWSWLTTYTPPNIWSSVTTSGNSSPVAATSIATATVIPTSSDGLGVGVTAGIAVTAVIAVVAILILLLFLRRRKRRLMKKEGEEAGDVFGGGRGPAKWKPDEEGPKNLKLDDLAPEVEVEAAVTIDEGAQKQVIVEEDITNARNYGYREQMDLLDILSQRT